MTSSAVSRRALIGGAALGGMTLGSLCLSEQVPAKAAEAAAAKAGGSLVPGTYVGIGTGRNGTVTVSVTVDEHSILDIEVVSHSETAVMSDNALQVLPLKMIALQSTDVDAVSGATLTSSVVISAVDEALEKAGGVDALDARPNGIDVISQHMTPGTYEAEAGGCWLPGSIEGTRFGAAETLELVKVAVTVDETSIQNVEILSCTDCPNFASPVIERIPASIVDQQSVFVDAVTGATRTSAAVLRAATLALIDAGADIAGFTKTKIKSEANEEYECDICIVGGGCSGTMAALVATESGAKVVILEKAGRIGGKGFCSSGISAAGARLEVEAGCTVTAHDLYKSLYDQSGGRTNSLLLKTIAEESGSTVDMLEEHGFTFKAPSPDATWDEAYMCPTGKGQEKFDVLYNDYILKNGGEYLLETRATSLIVENGKVVGANAVKQDGTKVTVRAGATIVGTGGFGGNPSLLKRFCFSENFYDRGLTTTCSGDGITMCENIGAQLGPEIIPHMQEYGANLTVDFTANLIKYITYAGFLQVNPEGRRFMDESLCISDPMGYGCAALRVQGFYYIILDQGIVDQLIEKGVGGYYHDEMPTYFDTAVVSRALVPLTTLQQNLDEAVEKGVAWKAESPDELAAAVGFADPGIFVEQYERYNELCAAGVDDDFDKIPQMMNGYSGTLYAVRMAIPIMGTLGGVKVNERLEAIDTDEKPIPGLYVCGQEGSGFYAYPYYATKCSTSTYAYTSGRLAGLSALAYLSK